MVVSQAAFNNTWRCLVIAGALVQCSMWTWLGCEEHSVYQQRRDVDPMVGECWSTVCDADPTFIKNGSASLIFRGAVFAVRGSAPRIKKKCRVLEGFNNAGASPARSRGPIRPRNRGLWRPADVLASKHWLISARRELNGLVPPVCDHGGGHG